MKAGKNFHVVTLHRRFKLNKHVVATSSCSFWVNPLTPFTAEAWPMKVITRISGAWWFNMAAISCTLSRKDEKIITRVPTSWGPGCETGQTEASCYQP